MKKYASMLGVNPLNCGMPEKKVSLSLVSSHPSIFQLRTDGGKRPTVGRPGANNCKGLSPVCGSILSNVELKIIT